MKIKLLYFLLLSILIQIACVTDTKQNSSQASTPKKRTNMTALAERLYQNFHDDPQTQAQRDENELIDYAVDKNLDAKRTKSGLYYIIHKEGSGENYISNQPCKAHYQGYFLDGKVFDSSFKRNEPLVFNVGQMIPGWNEALKIMNTGTKAQLLIPSHLAYGTRGFPGMIAPNTPLAFDLELLPL